MNSRIHSFVTRQTPGGASPALAAPCPGPCLSRRGFVAGCAACAAGSAVPALIARRAVAAPTARIVRVRLVFSHTTPDRITWPNVGFDYERRGRELQGQLEARCPGITFLPVHVLNAKQAEALMAADAEVDGYLLYVLGMQGGAAAVANAIGQAGRPLLVVEDPYAGPFSLGFNGRAEQAGWKAVAVSTSRMDDIARVTRCFRTLARAGVGAAEFHAAAHAAYHKCIGHPTDVMCHPDPLAPVDVGACLQRLRESRILLVGRDAGPAAKAIREEFGTTVIPIKPGELHAAFLGADPEEAGCCADSWIADAQRVVEPARQELVKSGAMHLGMQALMRQYDARAISINCLGGFYSGQLQAFPCLGFVELNNGGQVGACEGDLASTITMLAVGNLVGRPGMISDPVIDLATHRIIYAHCVAPTRVFGSSGRVSPYHVRDHSEDRKGAAIRALLPLGHLTSTMKFLPGRRQLLFHQAKTVENVAEDKACRTKLAAEVRGDIDKLFSQWTAGWHRVTFYGDLRAPVQELCRALQIEFIEEA